MSNTTNSNNAQTTPTPRKKRESYEKVSTPTKLSRLLAGADDYTVDDNGEIVTISVPALNLSTIQDAQSAKELIAHYVQTVEDRYKRDKAEIERFAKAWRKVYGPLEDQLSKLHQK